MSVNLLEADKALEQLLVELKSLQSSSQKLEEAEKAVTETVRSAEIFTELSAKVLDGSARQTATVETLASNFEVQLNGQLLPRLESLSNTNSAIDTRLQAEITPELKSTASSIASIETRLKTEVAPQLASLSSRLSSIETTLKTEVIPQLEAAVRVGRLNRWLILLTGILVIGNGVLSYLIYQMLLSR